MSNEIVVIGSGFAAQQLIKCLRRLDVEQPIRLITADAGDEYNKPDLSHVVSRQSSARSMIRQPGAEFAEQQRITLHSECPVLSIDRQRQIVVTSAGEFAYGQLVLATGATAMRPDFPGAEFLVSLNSLQEYAGIEERLRQASRIMILGAGLIGCELAMDMASDNRQVTLVDLADAPLSALLPEFLSQPLHQALRQQGIELLLGQAIAEIAPHPSENSPNRVQVTLSSGTQREPDLVLVAIGLCANTMLATDAGLAVGRGIRVDECLRTSDPAIFALGDCAEWQ
ncbi:MAG: FAD-dependent oxidoreductase, partial [Aeromonadaceae bacterium]